MNQFVAQRQNFIAHTPLFVQNTMGAMGSIRLLDKTNAYPNDGAPNHPTPLNYANLLVVRDNQRHARVTQTGGLAIGPAQTVVRFQITDAHALYGATVGGANMLAHGPGVGVPAFYLPFKTNKISSIRLGPQANFFFTDNLSGCSVFVDNPIGAPGPRVFHANAMALGRSQEAIDHMELLHTHHDFPNALAPQRSFKFDWTHYFTVAPAAVVAPLLARKQGWSLAHGWRSNVQGAVVGAAVFGFRDVGTGVWSFHYQVVADLSYDRPFFSTSRWTQGSHVPHKFYVAASGPLPAGP